jgi:DNA-binding transcriptional LysR family regulator
MQRGKLNDLLVFRAVATERSFTRAAAKLGVSQSALSHTIRGLEERLGLRLLTRTTRSVSPTEAGERLLHTVGPRFEEIEAELEALSELREKPGGTIRITATDYAADTILWPKLAKFLPQYPDIKVEIIIDYGLVDIVAERFDAGVRSGEQVAKVRRGNGLHGGKSRLLARGAQCRRRRSLLVLDIARQRIVTTEADKQRGIGNYRLTPIRPATPSPL